MTTTTIRIDDELKTRVAAAARSAGKSTHAFIVEAIEQTVEQAEQAEAHADFHRVADERWAKLLATGKSIGWDDARAYLQTWANGQRPRQPTARKFVR
jgi:predicted transcriptional regulator